MRQKKELWTDIKEWMEMTAGATQDGWKPQFTSASWREFRDRIGAVIENERENLLKANNSLNQELKALKKASGVKIEAIAALKQIASLSEMDDSEEDEPAIETLGRINNIARAALGWDACATRRNEED